MLQQPAISPLQVSQQEQNLLTVSMRSLQTLPAAQLQLIVRVKELELANRRLEVTRQQQHAQVRP